MYLNMHALLHTKNGHRVDPLQKRFGGWVLNKESIDKLGRVCELESICPACAVDAGMDRREKGHLRALQ